MPHSHMGTNISLFISFDYIKCIFASCICTVNIIEKYRTVSKFWEPVVYATLPYGFSFLITMHAVMFSAGDEIRENCNCEMRRINWSSEKCTLKVSSSEVS